MRNAKLHKIFLTALVSLLILVLAVVMIPQRSATALADEGEKASDYFTGINDANLSFENDNMVAKITEDSISTEDDEKGVLAFKNYLIVNEMLMEVKVPDSINALTVVFESEAYYSAGNPMVKKSFDNGNVVFEKDGDNYVYTSEETVVNELKFDFATNQATFNGNANHSGDFAAFINQGVLSLNVSVIDNYLVVNSIKANDLMDGATKLEYRKIKAIDDKSITKIRFMFDVDEQKVSADAPARFEIVSVNQKASDINYKQTFKLVDGDFEKKAYPVVAVSEEFYKKNAESKTYNYTIVKDLMTKYTLELKAFSVIGDVKDSSLYLKKDTNADNVWLESGTETPTSVQFNKIDTYSLIIAGPSADYDKISIEVKDFSKNDVAPSYVKKADYQDAYFAFEVALRNAYYDVEKGEHVALGQNVEVPSLKDLVFDDLNTYEQLTTMVYYANDNSDLGMAGSLSVPVDEAGDYYFFVVVADKNRNEMDKDKDFIKNEDNLNPQYADYVFTFHMVDDALIEVIKAKSQGKGYVGVDYTASAFTVNAQSCNITYKLYYCSDVNATKDSDWVEIPKASSVSDQGKLYDGFSYDDVQSIGYDGSLSFKPIKAGAYMIECTATSTITSRAESNYSIIKVSGEPEEVKVYSDWFKDNVWTVVFLSVGTLCLIGIVALLFVKPKDKVEE
ncbi:MAG: hypothetical protein IJC07_03860 [Clostridia bacterium]|nr:hypothetical protein [Clostridia bacterium]